MRIEPILFTPFLIQSLAMGVDEFYFHNRRGLNRWESLGHPLDTFSVLVSSGFILTRAFEPSSLKIYIGLSIFSCLLITKDEFVHIQVCSGGESWLHSLLFILHPLVLASMGTIWYLIYAQDFQSNRWFETPDPQFLKVLLYGQAISLFIFMFYQIFYWRLGWKLKLK